jgi:hypothetical protein
MHDGISSRFLNVCCVALFRIIVSARVGVSKDRFHHSFAEAMAASLMPWQFQNEKNAEQGSCAAQKS